MLRTPLNSNVRQLLMSQTEETVACNRCGEEIPPFTIGLPEIMVLQKLPREEHLQKLVSLAGVSPEVAEQWLHHGFYLECPKKVAHCPHCGAELRTWRAQLCVSCHRQWHKKA